MAAGKVDTTLHNPRPGRSRCPRLTALYAVPGSAELRDAIVLSPITR